MAGNNKSIRDFFKPSQPTMKTAVPATVRSPRPSPNFEASLPTRSSPSKPTFFSTPLNQGPSTSAKSPDPESYPSSLPPPPSISDPFQEASRPQRENIPLCSGSRVKVPERVIQASDDEDDGSDSSLEDLSAILAVKSSELRSRQAARGITPSTPVASQYQKKTYNFNTSPLPAMPKYKFNMKSLVEQAKRDEATEASSKRVKAMLALSDGVENDTIMPDHHVGGVKYGTLLQSMIVDKEEGEKAKLDQALKTTEATVVEKHWNFFETQKKKLPRANGSPFPASSVPKTWRKQLLEPQVRYQSFISGFAEDLVTYGKLLPDELFIWMLDELCIESSDPLRASYVNVLIQSEEQVNRLVLPRRIEKLFQNLGGTPIATAATQNIIPTRGILEPYSHHNWANLESVLHFLCGAVPTLEQSSRAYSICLLLRMSIDRIVIENVNIFELVRATIGRLCEYASQQGAYDTLYQEICTNMFNTVTQPSLRLRFMEAIPSTPPSSHDLRRRLAMCFYFEDLAYSKEHSHSLMDLDVFIRRLDTPDFRPSENTDFRDFAARIYFLDIAADDGLSTKLDLSDNAIERMHNEDVDDLVEKIREIRRNVGASTSSSIPEIEANEILGLVYPRIVDTMRSKRRPKHLLFEEDSRRRAEDLDAEKRGMASFITKMKKGAGNAASGKAKT